MLRCFLLLKNKLTRTRGENDMINKIRLRAYTKTMANGTRTIYEIPELYQVPVYLELIADYKWTLDMVEGEFLDEVKAELGVYEITLEQK